MAFEELKHRQSVAWGAAPFDRISQQAANIYDKNGYMFKVSVFVSNCVPYRDSASV